MLRRETYLLTTLALLAFCLVPTQAHASSSPRKSLSSDLMQPYHAHYGHKCIHDQVAARNGPAKRVDQVFTLDASFTDSNGRQHKRALNWQPFRVTVVLDTLEGDSRACTTAGTSVIVEGGGSYTCTANDILSDAKKQYLNESMLGTAAQRLGTLLKVDRVPSITVNANSGCSNLQVPSRFVPLADTDFILLVTARPIPSDGGSLRTLASATTCQTRAGDNRPIVGWANFDPSSLDPNDDSKLALQVGVAIHEISHALGFNKYAFDDLGMLNAAGTIVTHPLVATYVQNHFNCPSATGALLEDGGGDGTAGSHWEKASFMNEYMTGTASNNPVITALTLLAFQATGWYEADLTQSDSLVFGRNGGCDMITTWSGCDSWPSSYRCDAVSGQFSQCTADKAGYGVCVTEPQVGSIIGPGCSYFGSQTTCIFPFPPDSPQAQAKAGNSAFQSSGQTFAADSRCFSSTLNKITSLSDIVPVPAPSSPKCHRVHCTADNEVRILIDGIWYPCAPSGTKITATGFGGAVTCPENAYRDLCQYRTYDPDWPRLTGVSPKKSKPGTTITVTYTGAPGDGVLVRVETDCTENTITQNGTVTAKLAPDDYWGSPKYLNLFNTKLNVILKDSHGRSDVLYDAFQIDIKFGLAYLRALFNWMKKNVLFSVLACIAIAIPCLLACFCCYKKCCKKKKPKPQRTQYTHNYDRENDAYYYDEEMEDRSRHAPPPSIYH